jgi:hypothetical protein
MKAVFIRGYGGPEVLECREFPDAVVGAGDVLVKVAAAAINPIDIMERSGLTKDFKPVSFPGVLGWDLTGPSSRSGPTSSVSRWATRCLLGPTPHMLNCALSTLRFSPKFRTAWISLRRRHYPSLRLRETSWFRSQARSSEGKRRSWLALGGVDRSAVFTAEELGARVIAGVLKKQFAAARSAPIKSSRSTTRTR